MDYFPDPTALRGGAIDRPDLGAAPSFGALDRDEEARSRRARRWLMVAGGLGVIAVALFTINRLPYSAGKVDAMYAAYVAEHPTASFPEFFTRYQARREETADYIFQFCRAYERIFVERDPFAEAEQKTEERRTAVNAGQADPGPLDDLGSARGEEGGSTEATGSEERPVTDRQSLDRIHDVESVTRRIYPVGPQPFDTMRSIAGDDERGREMRELENELVSGKKETALRTIENDRDNRINGLHNLEKTTRDELAWFAENGTPKLRSIARRMNERLFAGKP